MNKNVRVYSLASNSEPHSEPRPRFHPSLPLSVMATKRAADISAASRARMRLTNGLVLTKPSRNAGGSSG
eukprot:15154544-Heterocapsa_arctica.AAC.1